jgi:hypothetical protein
MALPALLVTALAPTSAGPLPDDGLRSLLGERGYPVHPAVLAFEARFGGLGSDELTVGAGACLRSGVHAAPRGGRGDLVPVVYTASDGIGFLDGEGRGWFHDTIEESEATLAAGDGTALLCRVILWELRFAGEQRELEAGRGAGLAAQLGLPAVAEASDAEERWWSDGQTTIVEREGSTQVSGPEDVLAALAG